MGFLLQRSKRFSLNVKAFCQPSWLFRYFGLDKQNPRVIKQWSYFFVHLNLNSLWEWPYRIQNETIFPLSEVIFQGPCLIISIFLSLSNLIKTFEHSSFLQRLKKEKYIGSIHLYWKPNWVCFIKEDFDNEISICICNQ